MHIAIATSTRADWGLLRPLADALRTHNRLSIIATNMHLNAATGHTVDEILADGYDVAEQVPMDVEGDDAVARTHAMAVCMAGMADALHRLRPDALVILGDRYEMLATASAAAMARVPIVHIAGGTTSEGAIDNAIRNAITQLATVHLVEAEAFAHRVINMGADPRRVFVAGSLGVWNITHRQLLDTATLSDTLDGFVVDSNTLLVTYHPATLDGAGPLVRLTDFLAALDAMPGCNVLITAPNNDMGGDAMRRAIEIWAAARPDRVKYVPSLGMMRYLSAVLHCGAVVGNSSSGIVEVPSLGTPTVDVGIRQKGRLCAASVIHCGDDMRSVKMAIEKALSPEFQAFATSVDNPYYQPDTVDIMVNAIEKLKS